MAQQETTTNTNHFNINHPYNQNNKDYKNYNHHKQHHNCHGVQNKGVSFHHYTNQLQLQNVSYNKSDEANENNANVNDCNKLKCIRLNRLSEIMHQYTQYNSCCNDIYDLDENIFQSVNISLILNDFLHLIDTHNNNDKQFGYCNPRKCKIFKRHYRDRNKSTNNEKKRSNICCQTLDKLHCFFMHCYDATNQNFNQRLIRYNQLQMLDCEKETDPQKNDVKMYSFGYKFDYNNNEFGGISVFAKYSSFKQELIMNTICTLSVKQFESEYKKTEIYFTSDCIKKRYKNIQLEYLLSLMIYCNFSELQYEFSKTYRQHNGKYHNNFYHFAKYLKNVIHQFGTSINQKHNSIKSFYHGIDEKLLFPQYSGNGYGLYGVQIFCPLSTSSSLEVAANFANTKGLIIEFGGNQFGCNSSKYFDVAWLSDYGSEAECLFIQNEYRLHINNIIDVKIGCEYETILKAINIIHEIIAGYGISAANFKVVPDAMKSLIYKLVCNELSDKFPDEYKPFSSLKQYGKTLFHTFCQNRKWICIDYVKMKKLSMRLFSLFCNQQNGWINIKIINALFPNLEEIHIYNTQFSALIFNDVIRYLDDGVSKLNTVQILNANVTDINEIMYLDNYNLSTSSSVEILFHFGNKGRIMMCLKKKKCIRIKKKKMYYHP